MPLYDFKCKSCNDVSPYHLSAHTYDNDSKKLNCAACEASDLTRFYGNAKLFFSGMFHEVTIGGQTFATERAKKAYERENGYIPLSQEENQQEATKNKARHAKNDQVEIKKDVNEICQKIIHKHNSK